MTRVLFFLSILFTTCICSAATISFDDFPVTERFDVIVFPEATFTSSAELYIHPNGVCAIAFNCENDIFIDFTHPVNDLEFEVFGYDPPGDEFTAEVISFDILLASVPFTSQLIADLSSFSNITEYSVHWPKWLGRIHIQ